MKNELQDLEFLFTDTDTFLSAEEKNILKEIKGQEFVLKNENNDDKKNKFPLWLKKDRKIMFGLVKKGLLRTFSLDTGTYIFSKNNPLCRPITVEFNAYYAKIGKTESETKIFSQDEKDKIAFSRNFIAKWIFNKNKISNEQHIQFLTIFTTRISYTMSFPEFLLELFEKDIKKTGIEYRTLTPSYNIAHCSFCRTDFQVRDEHEETKCPKCGEKVVIR